MLWVAAHVLEWQDRYRRFVGQRELRRHGRLCRKRGLCTGGEADLNRIGSDRLGDVLEVGLTEIADSEIKPCSHLPKSVFGKTDRPWLGDTF